jgi:predicted O-linked N-acetylglucosamine transferase (SPINDLY family)
MRQFYELIDTENQYQQMWLEFINNKQGQNMNVMDNETTKEIMVLKQYIKLKPKDTRALKSLVNLYMMNKEYEKALELTGKLIDLNKLDYEAMYIAAAAYLYLDKDEQGLELAKKVIGIKKDFIGAYMAMVFYYDKKLLLKENIDTLHKVVSLVEQKNKNNLQNMEYDLFRQAWQQLGASNLLLGNISEAKNAYLKASEVKNDLVGKSVQYSGYLMCTNYDLSLSDKEMLAEHKKFNGFFTGISQYQHTAPPQKSKLRIGYISPDFCSHAVVFYCYPLLLNYDKEKFEVVCYHKGKEDITTEQMKSFGTGWRDISGLSEAEAALLIYEDKIDILVELAGHTAHNCLPILAYKPAPIQMCGIGYFNTTGLDTVDYFLTDHYVDPIGKNDAYFTEKLLRLPTTHWCYTNRLNEPDCQETAYFKNHYITFCSFNNFAKTTDRMLMLWKEILTRVSNSKLVLKNKVFESEYGCEQISQRLLRLGFRLAQIEFRPFTSNHMQEYLDMDIALDTYPYVGGATTCEALYMGVPVVTLIGNRHGSRFGYSMLKNIDLEECIAYTEEEYIEKAVALASDITRLNDLHKGLLRKKMLASPLMDGKRYMSELEQAYQTIWNGLVGNYSNDIPNKKITLEDALYRISKNDELEQNFAIVSSYTVEEIVEEVMKLAIDNNEKINLLNVIAVNFYENNQFDDVIPLLTAALSLDADNDVTLSNLGIVLYNFGEKYLAREYFSKIKNKDESIIALLEK